MGLLERTAFWSLITSVAFVVACLIKAIVWRILPNQVPVVINLITTLSFTAVFVPITFVISNWWADGAFNPKFPFALASVLVLSISLSLAMIRQLLGWDHLAKRDEEPTDFVPRLLDRTPQFAGQKIRRLTVDDHNVEIFFCSGEHTRLRMRFSDAVREMDGVDGFYIHRSHWVAKEAVQSMSRGNGRYFVTLNDGTVLPVGRTYKPNLDYLAAE